MKSKIFKKKQKGIAERKTETKRKQNVPYKAIGLSVLLWILVVWLFFSQGITRHIDIVEGQRAPTTIVASVDFECENLTETAFKKNEAASSIAPVFTVDPASADRTSKRMLALFQRIEDLSTAPTNQQQVIINSMNDLLLGSSVEATELISAFPAESIASARQAIMESIEHVMKTGVMSDELRITIFMDSPKKQLTIQTSPGGPSKTISQQDIHTKAQALQIISKSVSNNPAQVAALTRLLPTLISDNMSYDQITTTARRKQALDQVKPVIQQYTSGTPLVRAGESASAQTILLLQHHEQKRMEEQEMIEQILEILGNGILLLLGLVASAIFLRVIHPELIHQADKILLMVLLSLLTLGSARLLTYLSVQYSLISPAWLMYVLPYALAVMLASILLGSRAALCLGFWTSFASAVLLDQSFNTFALGILVTITATTTARKILRRSCLFRAAIWVCAVKVLFVLEAAILNRPVMSILIGQLTAAILAGIISTILTLLLLPLFEKIFKITTDIRLLELSDMGHPLLQKMAIQAPGTYHHSLMVATLAQNAAEAIGANSLLIRVCAYYHDIGKMAKPEFFTENIQHKENPHDELSPHMSALVISSHVKEGLALAKRHKLPQPVLDAIEQHHGNGLISFFYHKAKLQIEEAEASGEKINDADFRYGGAPAVSPEMAILSLADASEAASRSIEKPTPQKISNLMDDIFAMKIRDGQMDYASLTMAEINIVKQSFIFSLSNMLHGRIPYPKDDDNKHSKSTDKTSGTGKKATAAD